MGHTDEHCQVCANFQDRELEEGCWYCKKLKQTPQDKKALDYWLNGNNKGNCPSHRQAGK